MVKEIKKLFSAIIMECSFLIKDKYNRLIKIKKYLNGKNLKLNLGCGKSLKAGFINIDIMGPADIHLDLRKDLPFNKNTIYYIYTEHFLEHLDYYDGTLIKCLKNYYWILKKDGKLRIVIPNIEQAINAYINRDFEQYDHYDKKYNLRIPKKYATLIDLVNRFSYALGMHKYAYDFEKLEKILKAIGFKKVTKEDFNPKEDSERRKDFSLYVEAIK